MASTIEHKIVHSDKLAVFTCNDEIDERQIRFYVIENWKTLTRGMDNSTILFIAGVHGYQTGKLGPRSYIEDMKSQFSINVLKNCDSEWLLEEKQKRNIKFEFLAIPDFFINEETKEIDEDGLVSKIRSINPQITFMVICYSQILELKFLLEGSGLFAEMRINRNLNILSNGQILTMNDVQKEFIQTLAQQDNIEKDVVITGPVGSGKTILGLEAIIMKKSHYKKKYAISSSDCIDKLRVIIWIGESYHESMLKHQMLLNELSKSTNDCCLEIHTEWNHDQQPANFANVFHADKNYKAYSHTLVMFDEIYRSKMDKVNLLNIRNMDYIYCLRYTDDKAVQNNSKALEVNESTVECNLAHRQRSSQEILDLADYLLMHSNFAPVRRCDLKSFSSADIPLWIELDSPESFFEYFESNFPGDCEDVMLSWDGPQPYNLNEIEDFCRYKKWRCTEVVNIIGSEASCIILYDLYWFHYEYLTRAKTKLIIVTLQGKERYIVLFQNKSQYVF